MTRLTRSLRRSDAGASTVEYGLIVVAIAAVIVGVVFALGTAAKGLFSKTSSCVAASSGATC